MDSQKVIENLIEMTDQKMIEWDIDYTGKFIPQRLPDRDWAFPTPLEVFYVKINTECVYELGRFEPVMRCPTNLYIYYKNEQISEVHAEVQSLFDVVSLIVENKREHALDMFEEALCLRLNESETS